MSILKIHNTLGNKLEEFIPIDKNNIRIYACGPTVYNYAHIGNARMAVVNDLLVRFLRTIYPKVTYVSNITDIDDKIIAASEETKVAIKDLTTKFTKIYTCLFFYFYFSSCFYVSVFFFHREIFLLHELIHVF